MTRKLCCLLLLLIPATLCAQTRMQGTIIRMRITDCLEPQHGFMMAMSGAAKTEAPLQCPEYVLVSEKVVYVISGKSSEPLLPMADVTRFRFRKNEMLIRIDDAQKESRFHIKAMMMRAEWERSQMLVEAQAQAMISRHLDPAAIAETRGNE